MTATGGPGVSTVMSTAHACATPGSEEQLWEISAEFLAEGICAGERVVYFDDGTADAVLERLADDQVPVRGPLAAGQFTIVPPEATRAALRTPVSNVQAMVASTVDEATAAGYPGTRLTGQLSYALSRPGGVGLEEYCGSMDEVLAGRPARLLCIYDRTRFSDHFVEQMRGRHREELGRTAVYDDTLLRITRTGPARARLAGEVDHSNRAMVARLLESTLDGALRSHAAPTDITLDLASLRFLDVAGAVSLVHAAEAFPSTHRLVLARVRPRLMRVLDRCGAPFAAQLVVTPRLEVDDDTGPAAAGEIAS